MSPEDILAHRNALLLLLMKSYPAISWISQFNPDEAAPDGIFFAGIQMPGCGFVVYELPDTFWDTARATGCSVRDRAPEPGVAESDDALIRMSDWFEQIGGAA